MFIIHFSFLKTRHFAYFQLQDREHPCRGFTNHSEFPKRPRKVDEGTEEHPWWFKACSALGFPKYLIYSIVSHPQTIRENIFDSLRLLGAPTHTKRATWPLKKSHFRRTRRHLFFLPHGGGIKHNSSLKSTSFCLILILLQALPSCTKKGIHEEQLLALWGGK